MTTIERIPSVAELARKNLAALGLTNVKIVVDDGTLGFPENAPYNGIIITAATPSVPRPLIDQLAEGGRLVAPVGGREIQELVTLMRRGNEILNQAMEASVSFRSSESTAGRKIHEDNRYNPPLIRGYGGLSRRYAAPLRAGR